MWEKIIALDNKIKFIIVIIILLIIFGIILYYKNSTEENYDNVRTGNNVAELYFSPTCGHCMQFKPEWNKLASTNACTFKEYNCQKGECTSDIKYVPTLKINGKIYNGKMDYNSIIPYLQ
jgi:hypothetical protein